MYNSCHHQITRLQTFTSTGQFKMNSDAASQTDLQDCICANSIRLSSNSPVDINNCLNRINAVYNSLVSSNRLSAEEYLSNLTNMADSNAMCNVLKHAGCINVLSKIIHACDTNSEAITTRCKIKAEHSLSWFINKCGTIIERNVCYLLKEIRLMTRILETAASFNEDILPNTSVFTCVQLSTIDEYHISLCSQGAVPAILDLLTAYFKHSNKQNGNYGVSDNKLLCFSCILLTNLTFVQSENCILVCKREFILYLFICILSKPHKEQTDTLLSILFLLRNLTFRENFPLLLEYKRIDHLIEVVISLFLQFHSHSIQFVCLHVLENISSATMNINKNNGVSTSSTANHLICNFTGFLDFFLNKYLRMLMQSRSLEWIETYTTILRNISVQILRNSACLKIFKASKCYNTLIELLKDNTNTRIQINVCTIIWNACNYSKSFQHQLAKIRAFSFLSSIKSSENKTVAEFGIAICQLLINYSSSTLSKRRNQYNSPNELTVALTNNAQFDKDSRSNLNDMDCESDMLSINSFSLASSTTEQQFGLQTFDSDNHNLILFNHIRQVQNLNSNGDLEVSSKSYTNDKHINGNIIKVTNDYGTSRKPNDSALTKRANSNSSISKYLNGNDSDVVNHNGQATKHHANYDKQNPDIVSGDKQSSDCQIKEVSVQNSWRKNRNNLSRKIPLVSHSDIINDKMHTSKVINKSQIPTTSRLQSNADCLQNSRKCTKSTGKHKDVKVKHHDGFLHRFHWSQHQSNSESQPQTVLNATYDIHTGLQISDREQTGKKSSDQKLLTNCTTDRQPRGHTFNANPSRNVISGTKMSTSKNMQSLTQHRNPSGNRISKLPKLTKPLLNSVNEQNNQKRYGHFAKNDEKLPQKYAEVKCKQMKYISSIKSSPCLLQKNT
ncbi:hypothetical protein GJ496_000796 [Pomphorhynchus laevis]|nr:hypothetical protein GJ496_000796 [Pomphorhynchus laevis]